MTHDRRGFGSLRKLPSGRWQARYKIADTMHSAPQTFEAREDAEAFLAKTRRAVEDGTWRPDQPTGTPKAVVLLGEYAAAWLADRTLAPRTRAHYRALLENQINPTFERVPVKHIDPPSVRKWHADLGTSTPTLRAHAYSLLRAVLKDAVHDGLLAANPCVIRAAGNAKKVHKSEPASLAELEIIVGAVPDNYKSMILLAAWCALRFGEIAELRRKDVDLKAGMIRVRRGVVRVPTEIEGEDGETIGTIEIMADKPKTDSSVRDVDIPPHLIPILRSHIELHAAWGKDGLLFPAKDGVTQMAPSTLYKVYYPARKKAGRPDLRFHDLRHTGAVLAAQTGATLAELMARLGHSTPGAAMRYQHAAKGRGAEIAAALSKLAVPNA